MMPLSYANPDETVMIHRVGGSAEIRSHLENLGFIVGSQVKIVSKISGNVLVKVKESRIAISEEMARKIMVQN